MSAVESPTESTNLAAERLLVDKILKGSGSVSGPWRVAVYQRDDGADIYVFSEEHHNEGNCASKHVVGNHITNVVHEVVTQTKHAHVLVEHFLHAVDVEKTDESVCSVSPPTGSLENLRSCLEVLMNPAVCQNCKERIHFIDPRADLVCVLPDGNLFQAIKEYAVRRASSGDWSSATLILYEALIHPLWSILPDKKVLQGRLRGHFETFFARLSDEKRVKFRDMWTEHITDQFRDVLLAYESMHNKYCVGNNHDVDAFVVDVQDMLEQKYKMFTNTFLDLWTMCVIDTIPRGEVSAILVYLGSLHGIRVEMFLEDVGYGRKGFFSSGALRVMESENVEACVKTS